MGAMARGEQRAMMTQRWSLAMAELHVVGLSGTSWDMIQEMRRCDQAHWNYGRHTDRTRFSRG
jgi:hypothetical protein